MALKLKITKEQFEKLADNVKFEYVADGEEYRLQVDGIEDVGPLKRANQRLKDQLEQEQTAHDSTRDKLERIEKNPARKQGDIDALERQWTKEKEDAVNAIQSKLEGREKFISQTLLENAAQSIADRISTSPAVMRPHIERRLSVDMSGDVPVIKVLDKDGKASALTADKLGEEFVANKDFSSIIRVTKASGGAGSPSQNGGAVNRPSPTQGQGDKPANLAAASPSELVAVIAAKKAEQQQ
jgi:hypothetical protein